MKVYKFNSITDCDLKDAQILQFEDFVNSLYTDSPLKRRVREGDSASKKNLPCWLLTGELKDRVCDANVTSNELLTIDIDHIDPQIINIVKEELIKIPFVVLVARSVSAQGLFAFMKVCKSKKENKQYCLDIYNEIEEYLNTVLLSQNIYLTTDEGECVPAVINIDRSCYNLSRRRFESYDPNVYYNPDSLEYIEFNNAALYSYYDHKICELAKCFNADTKPTSSSIAVVLAIISLIANARVHGSLTNGESYAFKFYGVIIGRSGSGKSTLANFIKRYISECGVGKLILCESDRSFEYTLASSVAEYDKTQKKWVKKLTSHDSLIEIIDEAGEIRAGNSKKDYLANFRSLRRRAFDKTFIFSSSLNTILPDFPAAISYTSLSLSTPYAWVKATENDDVTAGDERRYLYFWNDSVFDSEKNPLVAVMSELYNAKNNINFSEFKEQTAAMRALIDPHKTDIIEYKSNINKWWLFKMTKDIINNNKQNDDISLLLAESTTLCCQLSIAAAFARSKAGEEKTIEDDDFLTAYCIFNASKTVKKRLLEETDVNSNSFSAKINTTIINYIKNHNSGKPFLSVVRRKFKTLGVEYSKALEELINGHILKKITSEDKKTVYITLTPEEEVDKYYDQIESTINDDELICIKKDESTLNLYRETTAKTRDLQLLEGLSRQEQVEKYIEAVRRNGAPTVGERNNRIFAMNIIFSKKLGWNDEETHLQLYNFARELGLSDREARTVTRTINN